jgi:hypothetical protein
MIADEINDWLPYRDTLQEMVGRLVGFPVEVYWVASYASGVGKGSSYQIMPACEAEHERRVFWWWHLDHNRQFYLTPLEAAAAFVRAWRRWVAEERREKV